MLIPAADHCALLISWESLVDGRVRLEYERTKVGELRKYRYRIYPEKDGVEDGAGDCCVGWDGWPGEWPKTVEEMKG